MEGTKVKRQGVPRVRRWGMNLGLGVDFAQCESMRINPGSPLAQKDQLLQGQSLGCATKPRITGLAFAVDTF